MSFKKNIVFSVFLFQSIIGMDKNIIDYGTSWQKPNKRLMTPSQQYAQDPARHSSFAQENTVAVPITSEAATALSAIAALQVYEIVGLQEQLHHHIHVLGKAIGFQSIQAALALDKLTFQAGTFSADISLSYQSYLQNTIHKINRILYDQQGFPRLNLTNYENYEIAKIITYDLIIPLQPKDYLTTIEKLVAAGIPGFAEVYQELIRENTLGHYIKAPFVVLKEYAYSLCKGVSAVFTHEGSYESHQKLIKENGLRNDLISIQDLCKKQQFLKAKEITEKYSQADTLAEKKISLLVNQLYLECSQEYAEGFIKRFNLQFSSELIKELIPLIPYIPNPEKTAEILYGTLEQYKNDARYNALKQFLNKSGLPLFYDYDRVLFNAISSVPATITDKDCVREQQLLFNFVTCCNKQEIDALLVGIQHIAKGCSGPLRKHYSDFAEAMLRSIESEHGDKTILQCSDFTKTQPLSTQEDMLRRVLPALTNLSNEINTLKQEKGNEERISYLKSLMLRLNKEFDALDHSATSQVAFNETITEILRELRVLDRPEMCRSKSQEDMYFSFQSLELLQTGKSESYSSHAMQKLQNVEQVIDKNLVYDRLIMGQLLENEALWSSQESHLRDEIINKYLVSSQESALLEIERIKLNRDTQFTLAENIEDVIKDSFKIVLFDFPINEIGDYAHETITHPGNYLLNIAKDFGELGYFLCSCVVDYSKNNISAFGATQKEAYEFSKKYNEAVHAFSKNWKELPIEHKKKFVAKLLVDIAANQALGSGAKLISQVMGDCILSMGEILPPSGMSGGVLAINHDIALIQEVAEVVQGIGDVVGSAPFGATAIQGFESLFDTMARRDGFVPTHVEGSYDYIEKCIKLINHADQPIESILDPKAVIHKVCLTSENKLIKEFDIIKNHYKHMFSNNHIDKKIMNVGINESNIIEKFTNIVLDLDRQGQLVENGVQIETIINGIDITIRVHVFNGKVGSLNGFAGFSNDVIGKLIKYTYKGL